MHHPAAQLTREEDFDPVEIAREMKNLTAPEAAVVLEILPLRVAADSANLTEPACLSAALARAESQRAAEVVSAMQPDAAAAALALMEPDDRVDLLAHLRKPLHKDLIHRMEARCAEETLDLEQYPRDSAGGIMNPHVTALPVDLTVEQAIGQLRALRQQNEALFYVYVIDTDRRLVGVLSMRDLILAMPDASVGAVMIPHVHSVPVLMDQEEVARQMRSSRFLALPVVDRQQRLVGLITLDDIIDVVQDEATEDVQRMFGAGAEERLSSPWRFSFSRRIWWLQVNLLTAFLAGGVVGLFNGMITRFAVLAIYMPVVSSMGSNAGAQAMAVAIRGITQGHVNRRMLRHVLARETLVGLFSGLAIAATTAAIALLFNFHHGAALGLIVGMSIVTTQTLACVSGAGIPFLMKRLGFDPAQSATIFATTVTDIAGFATLLGFARLCESWLR